VWNFKKWKDLGSDLDQQPANHCISNRDPVNIPPLQLTKKIPRIHPSVFSHTKSIHARQQSCSKKGQFGHWTRSACLLRICVTGLRLVFLTGRFLEPKRGFVKFPANRPSLRLCNKHSSPNRGAKFSAGGYNPIRDR